MTERKLTKKEFNNILKQVEETISRNKNVPIYKEWNLNMDFVISVPRKMSGLKEEWYNKGIIYDEEYVIVRAGYSQGPLRAMSFNVKTKEIDFLT
jgi:hypothetical protein